jgi:hypothetical protein
MENQKSGCYMAEEIGPAIYNPAALNRVNFTR